MIMEVIVKLFRPGKFHVTNRLFVLKPETHLEFLYCTLWTNITTDRCMCWWRWHLWSRKEGNNTHHAQYGRIL